MIYYILSPPSFQMSYDVEFEDFTTGSIDSEIALKMYLNSGIYSSIYMKSENLT
jgi:hypothetical protein